MRERGERKKKVFALVGAGRMGTGLALALVRKGWRPSWVCSRRRASVRRARSLLGGGRGTLDPARAAREAPMVLLGVPDDVLATLVEDLAREGAVRPGSYWIHLSGFHGLEPLAPAAREGARTLGLHPLQTVPDPREGPERLARAWFSLVGSPGDLPFGKALVRELGGKAVVLAGQDRPLYHAAAVLACNDLVALLHLASRVLEEASGGKLGWEAFAPLVRAALEGVEKLGPSRALTGPVVRGDWKVVKGHLEALGRRAPWALDAYKILGLEALGLALERGGRPGLDTIGRILGKDSSPGN